MFVCFMKFQEVQIGEIPQEEYLVQQRVNFFFLFFSCGLTATLGEKLTVGNILNRSVTIVDWHCLRNGNG